MKKLAHRGYSAKYPENTMEAFIKAYEQGFDGVETDVHLTLDDELVLIHDEKINRTSTGKGYVKDHTLKELRNYNFNYKAYGEYPIPTLKELLEFIQDKEFVVNIELKTDVIHYDGIEAKVLKELNPDAYVGYLMEFKYKKKYQELLENNILAFHPRYTFLNEKRVQELKQHNKIIATWTVPNFKEYQRLIDLGVDIIISNEYFK